MTEVTDNATFADTSCSEADGLFNYGKLSWTGGANSGASMEVKNWDGSGQIFTLWLPMTNVITVGDTYSVYPGCDKRFATCRSKFSNDINFGGFLCAGDGEYSEVSGGVIENKNTSSWKIFRSPCAGKFVQDPVRRAARTSER